MPPYPQEAFDSSPENPLVVAETCLSMHGKKFGAKWQQLYGVCAVGKRHPSNMDISIWSVLLSTTWHVKWQYRGYSFYFITERDNWTSNKKYQNIRIEGFICQQSIVGKELFTTRYEPEKIMSDMSSLLSKKDITNWWLRFIGIPRRLYQDKGMWLHFLFFFLKRDSNFLQSLYHVTHLPLLGAAAWALVIYMVFYNNPTIPASTFHRKGSYIVHIDYW